jgi:hypothetical protein
LSAGEIGLGRAEEVDVEPALREGRQLNHGNRFCGLPRIATQIVCERI